MSDVTTRGACDDAPRGYTPTAGISSSGTPANYTASQWAAVLECDRHLLVSAGAGTGKTHTVVGRLLWTLGVPIGGLVCGSPLRMRDIAAITFTNQAAADLKRKLREELRKAGRRDLAREVDVARVGTIHAFCGDILREFALRGGGSPGAEVLEEGEAGVLRAECAREVLMEVLESQEMAGLEELLADYSVREVERWACQLASDADRLRRLTDTYDLGGARERALLRLANATLTLLGERMQERGALDFDRMIVSTRDLMRSDVGVLRALRRRVRTLVVDEFQDVDPVQRDIAFLLGGVGEAGVDDDPTVTRLMLVGDPKQSIYRFRRADVTVWNEVERRFGEGGCGRVIQLAENRRSVAPVLAFVEQCIGPALDEPVDMDAGMRQPFEVSFSPVGVVRDDVPAHAGVEFLVAPAGADGKALATERARGLEADAVAARMVELHDLSGVPWKEMAILLPAWRDLPTYQDALGRRGIPTYALRNGGFYESRAVLDVILALQVARDPRDDRALTGFLRGPFVGVRDDTLLAIALRCGRPYWDDLATCGLADEGERVLLDRGRALVERLVALRDRVPVGELVEELVHESGFLAHLALLGDDGAQGIANVRRLLAELHGRRDVSVGALLREIQEIRDREDDVPQARLYGEREDVVTITSVHSAKGLEWGVVFWCDLGRTPKHDSEKLVVGRERILLGDPGIEARNQPDHWRELREREKQETLAERRRLWYVAATRAKELLVVSGILCGKKQPAATPAEMVVASYPRAADGVECEVEVSGVGVTFGAPVRLARAAQPEDLTPDGTDIVVHPGEEWLLPPPAPIAVPDGAGRHSATSLMLLDRCARRHWMRHVLGLREPELPEQGDAGGRSGVGRAPVTHGQAVHDVLERLREEADLELLLDQAMERWDPESPADDATGAGTARERWRERLAGEIRRLTTDPAYAAVAGLPTARRELPFLHLVSETEQVVGSMDLAACDARGIVILDVKTSRVEGEAEIASVAARYAVQRDVYAAAASAISGLPVSRFLFHFTHAGVQVDGGVAGEGVRFPEMAGVAEPPMTHEPWECVRCGYRVAGWCPGVPTSSAPVRPEPGSYGAPPRSLRAR